MDFVSAWKVASIILTGAFGVLGLLKEFKNKDTGRITRAGVISLAGIFVSVTFGVMAQLSEESAQQKARDDTAQKTLELTKNTAKTVRNLERVLFPLDQLKLNIWYDVPCDNARYKEFCFSMHNLKLYEHASIAQWKKWPGGKGILPVHLAFFSDAKQAQLFSEGRQIQEQADLWISLNANTEEKTLTAEKTDEGIVVYVKGEPPPDDIHSEGDIKSSVDLPGTTMFISIPLSELQLNVM